MQDFDLQARAYGPTELELAVTASPAGEVSGIDARIWPMDVFDLTRLDRTALRAEAIAFTHAIMPAPVRELWRESVGRAGPAGLRLRIRTADAISAALPWEMLFDLERNYFLAQDPHIAVVRYLEGPIPDVTESIEGPLRILLTGASPSDLDALAVGSELDGIESILAAAKRARWVEITRLDNLTLDGLDRALLETRPHVFHFSGHGAWDEAAETGHLALDDGAGKCVALADNMLAMLLRNRGAALVVLNACDTAVGGHGWAGLAHALVLAGTPSIVAMQTPITDAAATAFAGALYNALAHAYSLEQAVTLARQTIARQPEDAVSPGEWLAPALFMRAGGERFWLRKEAEKEGARAGGIVINKIDAVNVGETQIIDQRGAKIETGGGAYIGGDFVGRDKIERSQPS